MWTAPSREALSVVFVGSVIFLSESVYSGNATILPPFDFARRGNASKYPCSYRFLRRPIQPLHPVDSFIYFLARRLVPLPIQLRSQIYRDLQGAYHREALCRTVQDHAINRGEGARRSEKRAKRRAKTPVQALGSKYGQRTRKRTLNGIGMKTGERVRT